MVMHRLKCKMIKISSIRGKKKKKKFIIAAWPITVKKIKEDSIVLFL